MTQCNLPVPPFYHKGDHMTHAVLTDSHVHYATTHNGKRSMRSVPIPYHLDHMGKIHQLGRELQISTFWILPGTAWDVEDNSFLSATDGQQYDLFISRSDKSDPQSPPLFARIWERNGPRGITYLGYPDRGRWQWEIEQPLDILATVMYLEDVFSQHIEHVPATTLGARIPVHVRWSPGHMGQQLLKKVSSAHPEWLRDASYDLRELPFNQAAQDLNWKGELTRDDVGKWLHHYDKNSAYLAACCGVQLGTGDPVHVERGYIDCKLPGIYRVRVLESGNLNAPPLLHDKEWFTSDLLQYACSRGYQFEVLEGYQFQDYHQALAKWAKTLWDVRCHLDVRRGQTHDFPYAVGRDNAYRTIKEIATISVGMLAAGKVTYGSGAILRPNWLPDVVSKARVNVFRNLEKLQLTRARRLFMIVTDGLWFVCDDPDPTTAVPGILARDSELGGYKYEDSVPITPEMVEYAATVGPKNSGLMKRYIDQMGESDGQ